MLSRRGFLGSLLTGVAGLTAAAAVPVFDPEHALWLPGARTFFDLGAGRPLTDADYRVWNAVDPDGLYEWRGNNLLTTDLITREALAVLRKQLTFANCVNRSYDDKFGCVELGSAIRIPQRHHRVEGEYLFTLKSVYKLELDQESAKRIARVDGVTG